MITASTRFPSTLNCAPRSRIEAEHQDLARREADLAEEILTRLAWHFGLEAFHQLVGNC